jgi:hypothetical protein
MPSKKTPKKTAPKRTGKRQPTATEKTLKAIDEAARLYWEGESWATITTVLYGAGLWRRKSARSAQDIKHEHPDEWATACERWRRRLMGHADRDAYLTNRALLGYATKELDDTLLKEALGKLSGRERIDALLAVARSRREDHALRQRAAHSISANIQRNRERNPIGFDLAAMIGPLNDTTRKQLGDEILDNLKNPHNADLLLQIKGKVDSEA